MKKSLLFLVLVVSSTIVAASACNFKKDNHVKGCKNIDDIYKIIDDAIYVGAPTYNEGNPLGCYRIYEGAAYKIIHLYGSKCSDIKKLLQTALVKCDDYTTASDRAWVLRTAFDAILGVPTIREKSK